MNWNELVKALLFLIKQMFKYDFLIKVKKVFLPFLNNVKDLFMIININ